MLARQDYVDESGPAWQRVERLSLRQIAFVELRHPSPMSLPLMVERFREKLTTEQLSTRLDRILKDMERDTR